MLAKWLRRSRDRAGGLAVPEGERSGVETGPGRRPWVLHPFLIAIFPILSLYVHNVNELPIGTLLIPVGLSLTATFSFWLAFRFASGDWSRAGLAASLVVASFYGFQGITWALDAAWIFLNNLWVYREVQINPWLVLATLSIAIGAVIRLIFRGMGDPTRWTRVLNAFTIILVAMPTMTLISNRSRESGLKAPEAALPASKGRGWTPDIYFIVLDGFARADVMKDLYGLDAGPFLGRLERRGFFVGHQSTSNYCQTRLSLASTLNADYLDKLVDVTNPDLNPITDLIRENLVVKFLKPLGYRVVTFATGFDPTENPDADFYLRPKPGIPAFHRLLVEMTPLGVWLSEVEHNDTFTALRGQTLFLFDRLPTVGGIPGPTFTFAHILAPHPPFVFDERGGDVSPRSITFGPKGPSRLQGQVYGSPEYVHDAYRNESAYVMARVDRMIDQILAASPEPPIIILQSDHGAFLRYHPNDPEATDLRERFGILNAILVPGGKVEGLHDRMTSVNTFRAVLKHVVGADLPPLEPRNFFSTFQDPLKFIDVTERLHSDRERRRAFAYPESYPGLQ